MSLRTKQAVWFHLWNENIRQSIREYEKIREKELFCKKGHYYTRTEITNKGYVRKICNSCGALRHTEFRRQNAKKEKS